MSGPPEPALHPADVSGTRWAQSADVHKAGHLAGRLARAGSTVEFRYLPEYLDGNGPEVATTLPRTTDPVVAPAGAVPPFFAGLLPEGRRLASLRRAIKTSADDELSLLLAVGADPVGDVQVVPAGTPLRSPQPLVVVQRSFDEVSFADLMGDAGLIDPKALAGVQDKASAGMISVPVERRGRQYILKVDPPEYPGVVLDEAFFIRLAAGCGVSAVRADVVHDRDGRPGLLVERFDRVAGADGTVQSLAVEDGTQVLGRYPADKYNLSAEDVVLALSGLCSATVVAARDLFRQLCFAWLTGDGDVHAKNLSVLGTTSAEWRPAPAYDLPSTLFYGDRTLALPMQGRVDGLSRRTLLAFGAAVGLPERAAARTLDEVLAGTDGLPERLQASGLPFTAETLRTVGRSLRNRHRAALP